MYRYVSLRPWKQDGITRLWRVGLALTCVALAGCTRFTAKPLIPARTLDELESRTLTSPALRAFIETNVPALLQDQPWPRQQWELTGLTWAAFYFHPSLKVARAQWRVAQAGVITAGARPNPTLGVTPEYDVNPADDVSPWSPSVGFDVPIETAGKRKFRMDRADHLSAAAGLNIRTTAWRVRSDVRTALLDVVVAEERVHLLQAQLSLQQQIVDLMEQRVQVGEISRADITAAHVNLSRTQTDLAGARREEARAGAAVASAVGIPLSALNEVKLNFDIAQAPNAGPLTSGDIRRQALQNRSDILGALAEYAASQSALQLEIAKQYPDIHLGPGYQWDQGESKWQLGLSVELPLLNRNQGPIAEAKARREEAAACFVALQSKVLTEIDTTATVLRASRENLRAVQSFAATLKQQTGMVAAQYQAGAADRLDWLNAQFEAGASALSLLDAQKALQQALGALEDAVQHPLEGDDRFAALLDDEIQAPEDQP